MHSRIMGELRAIRHSLHQIKQHLNIIEIEGEIEMAWIDDMRAELATNTSVAQSGVVAVNALADKVQELINNGSDPAELQSFVDTLRDNDVKLSDAIKARTAAATDPAPTPVEPKVDPTA